MLSGCRVKGAGFGFYEGIRRAVKVYGLGF